MQVLSSSYAGEAKAPHTVAFHSVFTSVPSKPSEDQGKEARGKEKQERTTSEVSKESLHRSYEHGRELQERDGWGVAWDRGREREREHERYRDRSHHYRRERSGDEDRQRSRDHDREWSHQSHGRSSESSDYEGWTEVQYKSRDKHCHH